MIVIDFPLLLGRVPTFSLCGREVGTNYPQALTQPSPVGKVASHLKERPPKSLHRPVQAGERQMVPKLATLSSDIHSWAKSLTSKFFVVALATTSGYKEGTIICGLMKKKNCLSEAY